MWPLVLTSVLMAPPFHAADVHPTVQKGVVKFEPLGDQHNIPERYRLAAHTFTYELEKKRDLPLSGLEVHHLRFPSPVTTDCPENNTVFAEYYRPQGPGPFPASSFSISRRAIRTCPD